MAPNKLPKCGVPVLCIPVSILDIIICLRSKNTYYKENRDKYKFLFLTGMAYKKNVFIVFWRPWVLIWLFTKNSKKR